MSAYERVMGGKLSFKGGYGVDKLINKKNKKKKKKSTNSSISEEKEEEQDHQENLTIHNSEEEEEEEGAAKTNDKRPSTASGYVIDTGTGFAPDGSKKSKHYEELFPVETKRFGYVVPQVQSREAALDERVKRKADRYCK